MVVVVFLDFWTGEDEGAVILHNIASHQVTQHLISEEQIPQTHCCDNLKTHKIPCVLCVHKV